MNNVEKRLSNRKLYKIRFKISFKFALWLYLSYGIYNLLYFIIILLLYYYFIMLLYYYFILLLLYYYIIILLLYFNERYETHQWKHFIKVTRNFIFIWILCNSIFFFSRQSNKFFRFIISENCIIALFDLINYLLNLCISNLFFFSSHFNFIYWISKRYFLLGRHFLNFDRTIYYILYQLFYLHSCIPLMHYFSMWFHSKLSFRNNLSQYYKYFNFYKFHNIMQFR